MEKSDKILTIALLIVAAVLLAVALALPAEVILAWDQSETATGYKVYHGMGPRQYQAPLDVGDALTGQLILGPGHYYFAVTAYNQYGESGYSEEVDETIYYPSDFNHDGCVGGVDFSIFAWRFATGQLNGLTWSQFNQDWGKCL